MNRISFLMAIAIFVSSCAGNAGGAEYTCRANDGSSCTEFISGFTQDMALGSCNTLSSSFSDTLACPGGRIAHCTVSYMGTVSVIDWYAPYTVAEARANCPAPHVFETD